MRFKPLAATSRLRFTLLRCSRGSVPDIRVSAAIRFPNDWWLSVEPGKDVARCNLSRWSFQIKMLHSLLETVESETARCILWSCIVFLRDASSWYAGKEQEFTGGRIFLSCGRCGSQGTVRVVPVDSVGAERSSRSKGLFELSLQTAYLQIPKAI